MSTSSSTSSKAPKKDSKIPQDRLFTLKKFLMQKIEMIEKKLINLQNEKGIQFTSLEKRFNLDIESKFKKLESKFNELFSRQKIKIDKQFEYFQKEINLTTNKIEVLKEQLKKDATIKNLEEENEKLKEELNDLTKRVESLESYFND